MDPHSVPHSVPMDTNNHVNITDHSTQGILPGGCIVPNPNDSSGIHLPGGWVHHHDHGHHGGQIPNDDIWNKIAQNPLKSQLLKDLHPPGYPGDFCSTPEHAGYGHHGGVHHGGIFYPSDEIVFK